MQTRIVTESIAAESPKFTAPIVLVHGLWCTAAVWRKCMGYFAHRGWTCYALTLRGHGQRDDVAIGAVRFADYLADLRQVVTACETPPIVIGHDLGGVLALHCRAPETRALVALAPLVPHPLATGASRAFAGVRARLAMLRGSSLPPPRGQVGASYFGGGVPGGTVADSGSAARELCRDELRLPLEADVPTLVMVGERDPFARPGDVERLARHISAEFRCIAGAGHALPWQPGWEVRVAEIHRWLIQTLGEPLLAMRDEDG